MELFVRVYVDCIVVDRSAWAPFYIMPSPVQYVLSIGVALGIFWVIDVVIFNLGGHASITFAVLSHIETVDAFKPRLRGLYSTIALVESLFLSVSVALLLAKSDAFSDSMLHSAYLGSACGSVIFKIRLRTA